MSNIIESILIKRGVPLEEHEAFLNPSYEITSHNPFLLPDMQKAVKRIVDAYNNKESIVIYGDYDVDGMTATAILYDALQKFGLKVETYTPNRFSEGYGLNMNAMRSLARTDASLVITVDCGSLSHEEIDIAGKLGLDVIVTDHHAVSETMPKAVATINPHRKDSKYPFEDLAGCGVAFKLVQALQTKLKGIEEGHEKWFLDLVALGTICDIVPLLDENRMMVFWGLEVLKKTKRSGLKALMAVAGIMPSQVNAQKVGFVIGPRLNAAGRIATAKSALELLTTNDNKRALELAQQLDGLNSARRLEQDKIFKSARSKLGSNPKDSVIIVANNDWNEGVIGIVASKLMEQYKKPTFVLSVNEDKVKGSGRSFGDFDLAKAISETSNYLEKGGGHSAAGGITLLQDNIKTWQQALNQYYKSLKLKNQEKYLLAEEDITESSFNKLDINLVKEISKLEPFGMGNLQPVFRLTEMSVIYVDRIGREKNHLKMTLSDGNNKLKFVAFNPPEDWFVLPESKVDVWVNLDINEWQGCQSVEGRILRLSQI